MQVILKQEVPKLGKTLDVVNVKNGFARNFLVPQGMAVMASAGNIKQVAESKKQAENREEKKLKSARQLAKKVEKVPCTIAVKVKENDELFGSVSAQEIYEFLKKEGFDLEKNTIELEEPIKQLGVYTVNINLYKGESAKLKVWVVKEENA